MTSRSVLRVAVAVLLGYATMVVLSTGTTALLRALIDAARAQPAPGWYQGVDLGYSLVYMATGGAVAGRIGRFPAAAVLAAVFLALGLIGIIGGLDPAHSLPYQWATALVGPMVIYLAGRFSAATRPCAGSSMRSTDTT